MSARVLIRCAPEFACAGKLARRLDRLLQRLPGLCVLAPEDPQGVIAGYAQARGLSLETQAASPTHVVLVGDAAWLATVDASAWAGLPLRRVHVPITRVVNVDREQRADVVYIGRGTPWGNPYALGQDGDREEVIRKFRYDFERDLLRDGARFKQRLRALQGKRLGCHCKPAACHGDVLAEYLNAWDDGG